MTDAIPDPQAPDPRDGALAFGLGFLLAFRPLAGMDAPWHLAMGEAHLAEGLVLSHDPLSWIEGARPSDRGAWLGQVLFALAEELGFSVKSFHHAVEAYKIADLLAAKNVGASMWADWWGFKLEAYDGVEENVAMLAAMGGKAIVHSDSEIGIQRLNQEAAKALASGNRLGLGLSEDEAIKWITLNPAWALGVEKQTGTLEVGKMADVVVWDKFPLSMQASAQQVYIDGALVYDRSAPPRVWSDFEVGTEMEEVAP